MKKIITIGRQLGSRGCEIGKLLAKELNYKFYDKELLQEAAKKSGLCPESFKQIDEQPLNQESLWSMGANFFGAPNIYDNLDNFNTITTNSLFKIQNDTIKAIAQKEKAIFIGRCADYILREEDCLNIFIFAPIEFRIKTICERSSLSEKKALALIEKTDKNRAAYYNFYTDKKWGQASSYHLCIDSSRFGLEGIVGLLG